MKKVCLVLLALVLVLACGVANAAIRGTYHDLSSSNPNGTISAAVSSNKDDICGFCHFPHNASLAVPSAPLWNHNLTAATGGGLQWYTSSTYNGGTPAALGDISRVCLSCHDGTVGLGALINLIDGTATTVAGTDVTAGALTGFGLLSRDLRNDHPISFNYLDAETVDAELEPQDGATPLQVTGTNGITVQLFGTVKADAKVECASCHDVHGIAGVPNFLRVANTGSQLCLACHIK